MEISQKIVNDYVIINISGSLDIYTSTDFKTFILEKNQSAYSNIIINMEKLNYIDSSGIGMLIKIMNQIKESGGNFYIANMKEQLMKLFTVAGLSAYFNFIPEKEFKEKFQS
jgi:anti-sigma B factor antagonist